MFSNIRGNIKQNDESEAGTNAKALNRDDRPDTVYLYITNKAYIEEHPFLNSFEISSVKSHKTKMAHNYFIRLTVRVRGNEALIIIRLRCLPKESQSISKEKQVKS